MSINIILLKTNMAASLYYYPQILRSYSEHKLNLEIKKKEKKSFL